MRAENKWIHYKVTQSLLFTVAQREKLLTQVTKEGECVMSKGKIVLRVR